MSPKHSPLDFSADDWSHPHGVSMMSRQQAIPWNTILPDSDQEYYSYIFGRTSGREAKTQEYLFALLSELILKKSRNE